MPWTPSTPAERAQFRAGFRDLLPASPGTFAWGLVTGIAMVKSGLTLAQSVGMTLLVFAGSAQLASLPLIASAAPAWVIVLTALVVNLRFVIYSVALRHEFRTYSLARRLLLGYLMGDIGFVIYMNKVRREGRFEHRDWYFLGGSACNWIAWQSASLLGIFGAAFVPPEWGLSLAGTLALLALLIPLVNGRAAWLGVSVAAVVSIVGAAWPLKLGLVAAVTAGIAAAMLSERKPPRVETRPAPRSAS